MSTSRIKRNIPLDYSFTFISNFNLLHALWMIYLHLKGFSLLELGILEGTFHLTSFLMEVPTGAVADLWGRKQSRTMGRIFALFGLLFLRCSNSLWMQMAGFALSALSYNLESGAGEALVYDSLKNLGHEEHYKRVAGLRELCYQIASASSILLGGYLASRIGYDAVFILMGGIILLSIFNALLLTEPPMDSPIKSHARNSMGRRIILSIKTQSSSSLDVIRKDPRVAVLILFSESVFVLTTTFYYYLQTYWKADGVSEFHIGLIIALQCIVSGISGLAAHRIEKHFGETGLLSLLPLLQLVCLWGIAVSPWKLVFFILTGLSEGVLFVAISDYINKAIPSKFRATILSFQSMLFSVLMILIFPLLGWIGDRWSLELGFGVCSCVALILYLIFLKYSLPIIKERQITDNS